MKGSTSLSIQHSSFQKHDDVTVQVLFEEFGARARSFEDEPARLIARGEEEEFFARLGSAEVADARRSQPAAAHDAVAGRARPARLDRERAQAAREREARADHRRVADAEAVRVRARERYSCALAVQLARQRRESAEQQLDGA